MTNRDELLARYPELADPKTLQSLPSIVHADEDVTITKQAVAEVMDELA